MRNWMTARFERTESCSDAYAITVSIPALALLVYGFWSTGVF